MRLLVLALVAVVAAAVVGSAFACPRMQSVQKSYPATAEGPVTTPVSPVVPPKIGG
jgi:hypothetical protein